MRTPVWNVLVPPRLPALGCFVRCLWCPRFSDADERWRCSSHCMECGASSRDILKTWLPTICCRSWHPLQMDFFYIYMYIYFWSFSSSIAKCLIPTFITMQHDGQINIIQFILASLSFQRIVKIPHFFPNCVVQTVLILSQKTKKKKTRKTYCSLLLFRILTLRFFSSFYNQYSKFLFNCRKHWNGKSFFFLPDGVV